MRRAASPNVAGVTNFADAARIRTTANIMAAPEAADATVPFINVAPNALRPRRGAHGNALPQPLTTAPAGHHRIDGHGDLLTRARNGRRWMADGVSPRSRVPARTCRSTAGH